MMQWHLCVCHSAQATVDGKRGSGLGFILYRINNCIICNNRLKAKPRAKPGRQAWRQGGNNMLAEKIGCAPDCVALRSPQEAGCPLSAGPTAVLLSIKALLSKAKLNTCCIISNVFYYDPLNDFRHFEKKNIIIIIKFI